MNKYLEKIASKLLVKITPGKFPKIPPHKGRDMSAVIDHLTKHEGHDNLYNRAGKLKPETLRPQYGKDKEYQGFIRMSPRGTRSRLYKKNG